MLSVRQSSSPCTPLLKSVCGHLLPKFVALRTPCQVAAAAGGRQRRLPTGGAAKGIPRKARKLPSIAPCSWPDWVQTTVDVLTQARGGPVTGPPPPHALRRPKLQIEVRSHRDFFIMSIQDCIRYTRARFRLLRSNYFGAVGC